MDIQDDGEANGADVVVVHLAGPYIAFLYAMDIAVGGTGLAPGLPAS
jgi:hypothetical protein